MSLSLQDCLNPSQQKFYNDLLRYDKIAAMRYLQAARKTQRKYLKNWKKAIGKRKVKEVVAVG